ncbi:protein saf1 [Acrodontium crateriforme]|uniref:Protein saf1 n=1 Tax=Acrodontium crateriforme TaxID=150365 RepID=A0AAQ3R1Z3_9PEZI|nr:protein saf1 [Acrodontium crateriforme]
MPKERNFNPAQAQRKADKQKEIAKSKKQQQTQRNEKLARRNPERLQRQIDELKELDSRGILRPKDKGTLVQLERDLKGVRRAREALGDAAPKFATHERRDRDSHGGRSDPRQEQRERRQNLGKRRRDDNDEENDDGNDTDPEVQSIPMPRDTPPPFPRQPMQESQIGPDGKRIPHALPGKPLVSAPPPKISYSSAPQIRDLKKEAVKFMPTVVAQQKSRMKGQGKLLEPEELDRLEKSGYGAAAEPLKSKTTASSQARRAEGDLDLDAEALRFQREIEELQQSHTQATSKHAVVLEEVEDDGT